MILGFLLLDSGGTTLIHKDYAGILKEHEVLFSSIMTAVSQALQTIMKTYIRHIELEKYHLYFKFSRNYVLVVISDVEDDRLFSLIDNVLGDLETLNVDPDAIRFDSHTKEEVMSLIEKHIVKYPPSMGTVRKLAEKIERSRLEGSDTIELELCGLVPKMEFIERKELRIKPAFVGGIDLDMLFQKYLEGNVEEVIRLAPRVFYEGDVPKVLYAKAALKLNSFDMSIPAPPLDFVYGTVLSIDDDVLRNYLLFEFKEFFDLDAPRNKIKLVEIKKEHILAALDGEYPRNIAYVVALTSVAIPDIIAKIRNILGNKSEWLILELERYELLSQMFRGLQLSFDEWNLRLSELRQRLTKVIGEETEIRYYYLLLIQIVYVMGLLLEGLTFKDAEHILSDVLDQMNNYYSEFEGKDQRVPNDLKADNYYLTLGIILGIMLDMLEKEKVVDTMKKYRGIIMRKIRWLRDAAFKHRIALNTYFRTISGLLASYTSIMAHFNIVVKNIPTIIKELAENFIEKLWGSDEYTYAMIMMDLLTCLGNVAIFIKDSRQREEILIEIAQLLERLYRFFEKMPFVSALSALRAIKFYAKSGKSEGKEKCFLILEEIRERYPQFYYQLAEKIISEA